MNGRTMLLMLLMLFATVAAGGCAPNRGVSLAPSATPVDSSMAGDGSVRAYLAAIDRYGIPGHAAYDPARAHALVEELLARHPRGSHVRDSRARLALLGEVIALGTELRRIKAIDLRPVVP